MTVEATQIPDATIVMLVVITIFSISVGLLYLLENSSSRTFRQLIISKKWLFRTLKYKIVKNKEGRYNIYQQTKLGFWYLVDYHYNEKAAEQYIYRRYTETIEEQTKYVKYITIKPETDPTKLIEHEKKTTNDESCL